MRHRGFGNVRPFGKVANRIATARRERQHGAGTTSESNVLA